MAKLTKAQRAALSKIDYFERGNGKIYTGAFRHGTTNALVKLGLIVQVDVPGFWNTRLRITDAGRAALKEASE